MKQSVLSRYERMDDGRIAIDVAASRVEDLYSNFDKSAPYIRRDLDADLGDYLASCAKEIKGEPFAIRFTLNQMPDAEIESRIRTSIPAYFLYLAESQQQQLVQMFRKATILFFIGLVILIISLLVHEALGSKPSVVASVFAEGLTIAAWVSLWEALAVFILEWSPYRKSMQLYRRIAEAALIFRSAIQA